MQVGKSRFLFEGFEITPTKDKPSPIKEHTRQKKNKGKDSITVSDDLPIEKGINPETYFTDVMKRLMGHSANKLHELLPSEWAKTQEPADTS